MGAAIRSYDWAATSLGAPERWPTSLKALVRVLLDAKRPTFAVWGPEQLRLDDDGQADGASGLRVLNSAARVDLLVTDVGLPGGMNGRQMTDAAGAARPGSKVLFVTG